MTSALVFSNNPTGPQTLVTDLGAVGIQVLACVEERQKLLQAVVRQAPDLLICDVAVPDAALFTALDIVGSTSALPVIVFTPDGDAGKITRATEVGVHAYVVNGYGQQRLRPLIHLAQARFAREQALRAELAEVSSRLEERKVVERAKGILMRARQMSDDDAFQMLRTTSMHSNQRLGQVSQHIIHSARFAEDVNRSGQVRMLSQRLVKLALLQAAGVPLPQLSERMHESVARTDTNLVALGKSLSQPTFGDLLGQVQHTWAQLKQGLADTRQPGRMAQLDVVAEQLLQDAERLTSSLENAGAMPPLQVLNLAGRQRMLSQRFAKYALIERLGAQAAMPRNTPALAEARTAFEQALCYLNEIPLSSPAIRVSLDNAAVGWDAMLAGVAAGAPGLEHVAAASEDLLAVFETLSEQYERSLQMLVG
ncbi:type IV pili methyl-accepting chemotaxis transducer N-terminal domain-containing protein [Polaromonas sp. SM01]|uniref:type IV pili methyl-accepting chemotaxis transducer N-terminal domain-containing protein n=1 Tax=Polaromonas sp. SM01 TaxID=3085630 RepID=UPI0029818885|nr:type IV pili methyl-accepting chemotaxis transducer N-terminal domain-containing protein [Polaromonas sp. SM01]MDW5443321.1 type IV pili methyl-accepting chemotaxis transducer N-terminal domain-containing protein [Polaromonas sp. SM01]